jgi:hypothetical protein
MLTGISKWNFASLPVFGADVGSANLDGPRLFGIQGYALMLTVY